MYEELKGVIPDGEYWYLATPYTKYKHGIEAANIHACSVAARLTICGIPVFCPIAHSHAIAIIGGVDPLDYTIWQPSYQPMLEHASGLIVVCMPGWDESTGIKHEMKHFITEHKPRAYMDWPSMEISEVILK